MSLFHGAPNNHFYKSGMRVASATQIGIKACNSIIAMARLERFAFFMLLYLYCDKTQALFKVRRDQTNCFRSFVPQKTYEKSAALSVEVGSVSAQVHAHDASLDFALRQLCLFMVDRR